jgi:hypothetical protein
MTHVALDEDLSLPLLRVATDPALRQAVYDHLGDYCHQCRNWLNSMKLSLYLARRNPSGVALDRWEAIEEHYAGLERLVERMQLLCRPMTLTRVQLGLDLLVAEHGAAWTRTLAEQGRELVFDPPSRRTVASFDPGVLGEALDGLVSWRGSEPSAGPSSRLGWSVEAGRAVVFWHEEPAGKPASEPRTRACLEASAWTLPLVARVVQAHGGEYRLETDSGWRLELTWPSSVAPALPIPTVELDPTRQPA